MMKSALIIMGIWLAVLPVFGQDLPDGRDFPRYPVPSEVLLKSSVKLPPKVNLAKSKYFPDIFLQHGWSCNQSSSVGYLLTYELNRLRNADAALPENQYLPLYVWNFLNGANSSNGVSYFDSWEIVKAGGVPNSVDYPNINDVRFWMSGYDRYYRAMQNRVVENWSMPIGTPDELQVLKRYLFDHFDGSKFGGMANFQIASGGMHLGKLPKNSYDEDAAYITGFGTSVGHALTIVGYNDSIRLDRNADGQYTTNIDINGDHILDLKDYEKGALIVANTYGKTWGDNGFAYVPYNLLALYGWEGGLWNRSVHIVEAASTIVPILTLRTELTHAYRNGIKIMAGVSNDPDATEPEHVIDFPMFNYQGGPHPLYNQDRSDTTVFELGLDISPLIDFIDTDGPVRIFLIIDNKSSWNGNNGRVNSMMVYNDFNSRDSTRSDQTRVEIQNNKRTLVSVVRSVRFNRMEIKEVPKILAKPGEYVSVQMEVSGAASPYVWELVPDYTIGFEKADMPDWGGDLLYNGQFGNPITKVDLPFKFSYFGQEYDHFSITEDAELLFDQEERGYPYAIDGDLVFPSVRKVNGYGTDLDYYMEGNSISWYANDTMAAIRWNAMAPSDMGGVEVNIVCEIHPDGRVRFIYDKPADLFPAGAIKDLGVSNGDNRLYCRTREFNPDQSGEFNSLMIKPFLYPKETKFDQTGWLFCRPEHANKLYEIKVRVTDKNNRMSYSTVRISTADLSTADLLSGSYPNPFVEEARFRIAVPEKSTVVAEIFNLLGSRVATLMSGEYSAAEYEVLWNGTTGSGALVGPGVYICRLTVGDHVESRKFIKSK
jgi:hypothetical protein